MRVAFIQNEPLAEPLTLGVAGAVTFGGGEARAFLPRADTEVEDRVRRYAPRLLVFPVWTGMEDWAARWSARLREACGGTPVVWIGQHGLDHQDAVETPGVDLVVPREPEIVVPDLLWRLGREKELIGAPGTVGRSEGQRVTGPALGSTDPASLPIADLQIYSELPFILGQRTLPFVIGRGNLENNHAQWRAPVTEVRRRFAVAAKLPFEEAIRRLHVHMQRRPCTRRVAFRDDSFLQHDQDQVRPFLERYGVEIRRPFSLLARAEDLRADLVRALATAGCDRVKLDVVSGDADLRAAVGQAVDDGTIRDAVQSLRKEGIAVETVSFAGLPGETEATLGRTTDLLATLRPDRACVVSMEGPMAPAIEKLARLAPIVAEAPWLGPALRRAASVLPTAVPRAAFQLHHDWSFVRGGELGAAEVARVAFALRG